MSTGNPTCMGYKTGRHYQRVARDIQSYRNSLREFDELTTVIDVQQHHEYHHQSNSTDHATHSLTVTGRNFLSKFFSLNFPSFLIKTNM
jgi:hypothetical protein